MGSGRSGDLPRPVAVARGNEKGRVERAIRYIRDAFFAARSFTDLADLNRQADEWTTTRAAERSWVEDRTRTVRDAFADEKDKLLPARLRRPLGIEAPA